VAADQLGPARAIVVLSGGYRSGRWKPNDLRGRMGRGGLAHQGSPDSRRSGARSAGVPIVRGEEAFNRLGRSGGWAGAWGLRPQERV